MLNTTTTTTLNRAPKSLRARAAAAVVAGVCATVALSGAAVAAEGGSSTQADVFASHSTAELAETTHGQAQHAASAPSQEAQDSKGDDKPSAEDWVSPIAGDYELSATYGNSGDRWASKHSGQDFAVPNGTEVNAVHEGTVVKAGGNGAGDGPAYGNAVVVDHGDGTFTQYAHLSEVEVAVGDEVDTGEEIALSGNTGNSSGPHLHFEVRTTADYGSAIDPMKFLRDQDAEV
ncbi:peptidoglycan DD-metalloendopeptidase family protein [Streptomyces sp. 3MP-14]|uniref:Peptidoglycan DD-metalloendopeptidase family protein n=1 Tax=Streptomyces mimosae TaxID=2586635 RepID=A0A5N6ALJ1_9ACTN|nr:MULTISPECIES: M23 family metallopeptidase [Streptomyces]KAB8168770.1 peptidoglycan DD-metalloendopeptidase family protein [Streptomyces mimosae]KAB8177950.1 peptidoglycan DD-metalloendopeptidase family protein [Streptomyces sp. 3MP-14]